MYVVAFPCPRCTVERTVRQSNGQALCLNCLRRRRRPFGWRVAERAAAPVPVPRPTHADPALSAAVSGGRAAPANTEGDRAMNASGDFDSDLQMFVDPTREPAIARLRFLRWLAERGCLEHTPAGPPSGAYASTTPVVSARGADVLVG